ncbi:Asp-tRNA(Asn)/Glu-tRNA(Gln) amidotransferase subunit GatA [Haematospirillum jordaniae]|uniref:Glutamyl-tRNA(Gln) amidotransferase subunit A n=1 Tax=Haematospirillum jordaniae TaxID=1549855 RepID=A0A143DGP3_9PROT|nr:Asp-tRNA(Asn)/Glu-tRNA(Gln) amidotransferase subunit GatA [Haematospirillum jordaniae]AMW35308.1 aspartyl/glutamyl-tRNA amidotransferase subunit A [Haematospirillum jordaniae]NKD45138.1 Asp-tRNA(Asn)/Glu-tRNA(Gln) amidotransferase subunit GatA [Haematospirillum jordaniae]NKD56279.1 Asp-tRNA(Asn)/Glu-tRNA(Gln) amidotransferase subunit GatA [Haematospirillum jordaniae]NKD58336.1 Asp-tRNA(Asn)/Glu-tRNA(Gln) amidotransferase subunit GatA [Haematospirillum jordaniae]NKD66495.1 Asp-tRNA(Asn)/Glu-
MSVLDLTLAQARDALRSHTLSAVELVDAYIGVMEQKRPLNAFITETAEQARQQAVEADAALAAGSAGPMMGIPVGLKDLFCTEGVRTTAGSRMLEGFIPPYESTISANLRKAGAISLGKLNLDEFAMGGSNQTSWFGPARNPWQPRGQDVDLVPGGSSGGSAAAVAARMVLAATGTDTGGSIRQPAAYCGITGLKPTYGRCSRYGTIAFASSLDQAGPMTRTVRDAAIMLGAMAGFDPKDSTSADILVPDFEAALTGDIRGLKIGIPAEYRSDGLDPEVASLWDKGVSWLKDAGAEIHDITLPHTRYALATYYIVAPAEASSNLARYDGLRFGMRVEGKSLDEMYAKTRAAGFGEEVQRRILMGTYVLSAGYYDAYYLKAQKVRSCIARDFRDAFRSVDAILTPTAPTAAFALGAKMDDPIAMYLNDIFTVPASLAGLPGLSVPAGLNASGLPLGLQIIGRPFDEETVLRAGDVLEKAASFPGVPALVKG